MFSFTFNSKFNMSLLFLHCEMSLCSKRSHSNQRLPRVCSLLFFKLLPFSCMFNDLTKQGMSVSLVSPEVQYVVSEVFVWNDCSALSLLWLADLSESLSGLHLKLSRKHESMCNLPSIQQQQKISIHLIHYFSFFFYCVLCPTLLQTLSSTFSFSNVFTWMWDTAEASGCLLTLKLIVIFWLQSVSGSWVCHLFDFQVCTFGQVWQKEFT